MRSLFDWIWPIPFLVYAVLALLDVELDRTVQGIFLVSLIALLIVKFIAFVHASLKHRKGR